ncbi:MAG TPA: lipase family protein, partial [Baekduia sp.]|nr:lipase family protein [Baekduia sp.]
MHKMPVPCAAVAAAALLAAAPAPAAGAVPADAPAGAVVAAEPLPAQLRIPGADGKAFKLTYVTTDGRGRRALSTGQLLLPEGPAPAGGWPVLSWAHGTVGIGDACAPSVRGPALPERDLPYLRGWLERGYAIAASDYAGLGTEGVHAYLHGRSEAHNVVDAVKAARRYARNHLRSDEQLSGKWVAVGQSQGGGAAISTARHATAFGGRELDYRGAVGTGV